MRYSPQLLAGPPEDLSAAAVVDAVTAGLRRGCEKHGVWVNQILCCIALNYEWSPEVADIAIARFDDGSGGATCGVVGIDIAAGEQHFEEAIEKKAPNRHGESIARAREAGLGVTIHAGETGGVEHIRQALAAPLCATVCLFARAAGGVACTHACVRTGPPETLTLFPALPFIPFIYLASNPPPPSSLSLSLSLPSIFSLSRLLFRLETKLQRIGHGYAAAADPQMLSELRERGVHVEVCPSSSVETGGWRGAAAAARPVPRWEKHPAVAMREAGVSIGFNSDDPYVFGTALLEDMGIALADKGGGDGGRSTAGAAGSSASAAAAALGASADDDSTSGSTLAAAAATALTPGGMGFDRKALVKSVEDAIDASFADAEKKTALLAKLREYPV